MKIKRAAFLAGLALALTAGVAMATHTSIGLTSNLLARGSWDPEAARDFVKELKDIRSMDASTVAVVRATLDAGGTTDWHGHPGPSAVVVTRGVIRLTEPGRKGGCTNTDFFAGQAFVHPQGPHNFTNPTLPDPDDPTAGQAEFYVTYFAPPGPLLSHADPC